MPMIKLNKLRKQCYSYHYYKLNSYKSEEERKRKRRRRKKKKKEEEKGEEKTKECVIEWILTNNYGHCRSENGFPVRDLDTPFQKQSRR